MRRERIYLLVSMLGLALVWALLSYLQYSYAPRAIVNDLVASDKYSALDASVKAERYAVHGYGEKLIKFASEASNGFVQINENNAFRISHFLAYTDTDEAKEIAEKLYQRERRLDRLVGAHALLHYDAYPEEGLEKDSFLVESLLTQQKGHGKAVYRLAAEAVAHFEDEAVVPLFVEAAKQGKTIYTICNRLQRSEAPKAVEGMLACLESCNLYCEEIAVELLERGELSAIEVLIEGLKDAEDSFNLAAEKRAEVLSKLTNKELGELKAPWKEWWKKKRDSFTIPDNLAEKSKGTFTATAIFAWLLWSRYAIGLLAFGVAFVFGGIHISRQVANESRESERIEYAGLIPRACASVIDGALLALVFSPLELGAYYFLEGMPLLIVVAVALLLADIYFIFFHARYGATPGKMLAKLRVKTPELGAIGFYEAFNRSLVYLLMTCSTIAVIYATLSQLPPNSLQATGLIDTRKLFEFYQPFWGDTLEWTVLCWTVVEVIALYMSEKKRTLHDFIGRTVVIHES